MSIQIFPLCASDATMPGMDRKQLRVDNLRRLMRDYETAHDFARAAGLHPSYLSQLCSPNVGASSWRPLTERTAAKIERALKLPDGWLSTDHDARTDLAPNPADVDRVLAAIRRTIAQLHETSGTQHDTLVSLVEEVTAQAAVLQLAVIALCRRDPGLPVVLRDVMSQGATLAEDAGESRTARYVGLLAQAAEESSAGPESAMRGVLHRLVAARNGAAPPPG